MLTAPPQRFRPGLVAAAPPNKTAELGNPTHGLLQRRGLLRWGRALMDGTIQSLPFVEVTQHPTWHVPHPPRQTRGIKNPPSNDTIQRQAALQALATRQLAFFNTTPTFQNPVPDFNTPPARVPLYPLARVGDRVHWHGRQQQPFNGLDVLWRLDFLDVHGPQGPPGQGFPAVM